LLVSQWFMEAEISLSERANALRVRCVSEGRP
jgi:hypothetical protein